jgi:predicted MFS family arabinose efflux permease
LNEPQTRARTLVNGCFLIEGLNSFGTTFYFYYIYWFTGRVYHFSTVANLVLAAGVGLTYSAASVFGGRLAQRRGCFLALKLGSTLMALAIGLGGFVGSLAVHYFILFVGVFAMALTWPALEALVSEGDAPEHLPRNIGIYNLVWAGAGAMAYFLGGSIIKAWTFRAMFLVPAGVFVLQVLITLWLERRHKTFAFAQDANAPAGEDDEDERRHSPVPPATFLKMAWVANPLAYVAINTVFAVIPTLSVKLKLSVAAAGFICSLWQFVRAASFFLLWQWKMWHYRFRWLVTAYLAMTASFALMLTAPNLAMLIIAQIFFGLGTGLIYYSSLYYSMHVGEAKGEHGGVHEGMIGLGSCAGPAISAASLHLLPTFPNSGAMAVVLVLFGGWGVLMRLRYAKRR